MLTQFCFKCRIIPGYLLARHRQNKLLAFLKTQILILYEVELRPDDSCSKNQTNGHRKLKYHQAFSYSDRGKVIQYFALQYRCRFKGGKIECRIKTSYKPGKKDEYGKP